MAPALTEGGLEPDVRLKVAVTLIFRSGIKPVCCVTAAVIRERILPAGNKLLECNEPQKVLAELIRPTALRAKGQRLCQSAEKKSLSAVSTQKNC